MITGYVHSSVKDKKNTTINNEGCTNFKIRLRNYAIQKI